MFCIAPWTHTYISPQGERRLCCASREQHSFVKQYIDQDGSSNSTDFSPLTLEEHWNSDFMKYVRKNILAGKNIPECAICNQQILNLHTYKDYFTKTLFPHLVSQAKKNTDETGFTTMKPVSFDYRISNQCNFKCRMCGEQLSSSWEHEKRTHDLWSPQDDPWMTPPYQKKIQIFKDNVMLPELVAAIENKTIQEIYWVGGEPLTWPEHWSLMNKLIDNGHAQNVFCRYNTNLSLIEWKGQNLFSDILPHFKGYNICASIDATEQIGEYIRSGLVWSQWLDNFKQGLPYLAKQGEDSLVIDLTLTLPGLFDLKNLVAIAHKLNVKIYVKIIFSFDSSIVLSPFALPRKILDPLLDSLINDLSDKVTHKTEVVTETLMEMKKRPTFEEQYDDYKQGFITGRERILRLESIRKNSTTLESIYAVNKEVLNWWTKK